MHHWKIYREDADTDEPRRHLGEITADTMSDALQKASEYWEMSAHDLVAIQTNEENTLRIPVKQVNKPCEECGTSPALQYELAGITGVLCRECLQKEVDTVNRALQETSNEE